MVGYGVNKGIIPMVCSDMFKTVEKGEGGKKYQVMTTMLEIYNECIRVSIQLRCAAGLVAFKCGQLGSEERVNRSSSRCCSFFSPFL